MIANVGMHVRVLENARGLHTLRRDLLAALPISRFRWRRLHAIHHTGKIVDRRLTDADLDVALFDRRVGGIRLDDVDRRFSRSLNVWIRFDPNIERQYQRRHVIHAVLAEHTGDIVEDMVALVRFATAHYDVVQGGAARFATWADADAEGRRMRAGPETTPAAIARVSDAHWLLDTHVRRLYPITVFGPALWAKLPPMPAVEPAPRIIDVGDCKVLVAWPELVAPDDRAFLAGTKALRQWLWPYSVQNPVDAVGLDLPDLPQPEPVRRGGDAPAKRDASEARSDAGRDTTAPGASATNKRERKKKDPPKPLF